METDFAFLVLYFPIVAVLLVIGFIAPFLQNETIVFGVRIPAGETKNPLVEQLKKHYRHTYLAVMIPYSILLLFSLYNSYNKSVFTLGIILQVLITTYIYALYNHKMMVVKSSLNKVSVQPAEQAVLIDTKFREGKFMIPFAWFIPSLLVIMSCIFIIDKNYNKIPSVIPTRFNFAGQAIQFTAKTDFSVYLIPVISTTVLFIFAGIYFAIKRAKQQVSSGFPERAKLQDRRFRYLWSIYLVITAFILTAQFALMSLRADSLIILSNKLFSAIIILVPISILFGSIVLAIMTGQSGSRLKITTGEKEININVADDTVYWKFGMFYYNPDDPALMVPKRMGVGWSLNFGNPVSFLLLIALFGIPFIIKIFGKIK